jgi:hypothetical protein
MILKLRVFCIILSLPGPQFILFFLLGVEVIVRQDWVITIIPIIIGGVVIMEITIKAIIIGGVVIMEITINKAIRIRYR